MAHYKGPVRGSYCTARINIVKGEPATSFDRLLLKIVKESAKAHGRKFRLRYRGPHAAYQGFTYKADAWGASLYVY